MGWKSHLEATVGGGKRRGAHSLLVREKHATRLVPTPDAEKAGVVIGPDAEGVLGTSGLPVAGCQERFDGRGSAGHHQPVRREAALREAEGGAGFET